ncbi:MAG: gephyrin-like molybdotransferase Glp [Duganella sp.]
MKSTITGWILAGGRGTRMGRVDKGLQPFRGATLVGHVLARLAPQAGTVAINANRNLSQYQAAADVANDQAQTQVIADRIGGHEGPLAGLHTGLHHCRSALLLTAPCDTPFLPHDLAARLHAALVAQDADVAVAVTMEADEHGGALRRQLHPVLSLLKASLLPQLEAYLATGARRMEGWFNTLRVAEVLFEDSAAFRNINTLEQLQHHEQQAAAAPAAPASAAAHRAAEQASGADDDPLPVDEALRRMLDRVTTVADSARVGLLTALDRVLAGDIISPINVPAYDNSAMDGYALRGVDLPLDAGAGPLTLNVIGLALAGRPYTGTVGAGQCVRIMTGAAMPAGCDSVLPQELAAAVADGQVTIAPGSLRSGANRRRAGEDLAQGGVALPAGTLLRAAELGLLASLGIAEVTVKRRLKVAFFSTGDELRALGQPLDTGCVYDSNRYTLFGMLTRLGCEVIDMGIVRDDPQALAAALRSACTEADAIITSGGVSEGVADHTREVMALTGDVAFWKLAMRPGRPLAFGQVWDKGGDGNSKAWLFGLPGNPVAVMVSFYLFARPALLRMMGTTMGPTTPQLTLRARATETIRKRPGRTEYQRGIVSNGADGAPQVRLTGAQGSGILSSMTQANCIVVLGHGQGQVAAGEMVDIVPFDGLM